MSQPSHLEQAPENSQKFPLLKTSPQYQDPTGQLLQPPAPPCGTPQNGRNPQGNTSGPAQSVEAAQ